MGSLQNVTRWKPDGGDGAGCWACGPHHCWEGNGRAPSNPMAHAAEKRHKGGDMGSDGEPPSLLASVLEQAVQLQSRWLLEALVTTVSPGAGRDTPTLWVLSPPAAIRRLHGSCRSGQWPAFLNKESLWCSHEAPIGNATSDLYKKHGKSWLSFLPYLGLDASSSVLHSVSSSLPEATPLPRLANILRTPCVISKLRYTTGRLQGDADSKRDQSRDSEQTPSSSWSLILGCEMGFLNQKESFGDSLSCVLSGYCVCE